MIRVKNIDPPPKSLVIQGMELTGEYEWRSLVEGEVYFNGHAWKVATFDCDEPCLVALTRLKAPVLPKCPWCGRQLKINGFVDGVWGYIGCESNGCFAGPDFKTREQAISETIRVFGKGSEE